MTTCDPLAAARKLEAAGVERSQAEAIAQIVRNGQGDLATKADVARLETRLSFLQWVIGVRSAITLAIFGIVTAKSL